MPISSNTRPDPALVRTSATEQLAAFRGSPPPANGTLLSDREMEGQMRGLPDIYFQLGHTRAEAAEVDACAAVGYVMSQGRYAMRIYRKTNKGWSPHTYTLRVEVPEVQQPKRRGKRRLAQVTQSPVYSWSPYAPRSANGTHKRHGQRN